MAEAVALAQQSIEQAPVADSADETWASDLLNLLGAAVLAGDVDIASVLLPRLAPLAPLVIELSCVARHLGGAATLLGNHDEARGYYEQALNVCAKVRHRPETALTRLQIAELLLRHYPQERAEALLHLDFAISEFEAMKMQPALERAMRLRGRRRPPSERAEPAYPDGLTEREVEVLRLIAAGKSNREIAGELVVSVRTVDRHITNIYGKIDARGRADATAYVLGHGLVAST